MDFIFLRETHARVPPPPQKEPSRAYYGPVARFLSTAAGVASLSLIMALGSVSGGAVSSAANAAAFEARLSVVVSLDGGETKDRTTVICPGAGGGACRSLREHPEVLWPATDRVCTEIYGGPERARIRGEVNGRKVDVIVQRNNGCGIGDWSALRGVLPSVK